MQVKTDILSQFPAYRGGDLTCSETTFARYSAVQLMHIHRILRKLDSNNNENERWLLRTHVPNI